QLAQPERAVLVEPRRPARERPFPADVRRVAKPQTLIVPRIARDHIPGFVKRPFGHVRPPRGIERLVLHGEAALPAAIRPVKRPLPLDPRCLTCTPTPVDSRRPNALPFPQRSAVFG